MPPVGPAVSHEQRSPATPISPGTHNYMELVLVLLVVHRVSNLIPFCGCYCCIVCDVHAAKAVMSQLPARRPGGVR